MNKMLTWYAILHKRLLKKPGFVVILCAIIALGGLMTLASRESGSFVHIAVAAQESDAASERAIARLQAQSDIVRITRCDTPQEAIELVKSAKADTAWVLEAGLEERFARLAAGESQTLVQVYAVEDTSFVRLSREKLYGALFPDVSYHLYAQFVRDNLPNGADISSSLLKETYARYISDDDILAFEYLAQNEAASDGYLTAPLRGMFMVLMLFCGLAATMYYKNDEKKQVFYPLTLGKRALVMFANNLAAVSIAAVFVTVALAVSGLYPDVLHETVMMILLVLAIAGFCALLGTLAPSNNLLGALLPVVLVASLVLCPVFSNMRVPGVQWLLPGYYYLYGINDLRFAGPFMLYVLAVYPLTYWLYGVITKWRET